MGDRGSFSGLRSRRWYAIAAPLVAALALHDATGLADPLDEPWRIARADPAARLRSDDLSVRRGGAYALLRSRLTEAPGVSETERAAQDEGLLALLARETDLTARLTALTALALPLGRDPFFVGARVASLRLQDTAPPPLSLGALHAFGLTAALLSGAGQEAWAVPDDDRAALSLDALARRPDVTPEGIPVDEPLRWRIMARRGDPSAASAIVTELTRATHEIRGIRGMSALRAARSLRLAEATPALVAIARGAPERELRRQATAALGDLGGVTTEDLVALIDDPLTRASALAAAARLGHRGALPAVRQCLRGDDPGDRAAALAALAALEAPTPSRPAPTGRAREGESVAALERRLLTDVDGEVRVAAAMALARRRGAGALRVIEAATTVAWSAAMLDGLSLAAAIARDPTLAAEP